MNRSAWLFGALAIAGLLLIARLMAGPGLTALLFDGGARSDPASVLIVVEGHRLSAEQASSLVVEVGGTLRWFGHLDTTVMGDIRRSGTTAALVSFATGGDVLRAATGGVFDDWLDSVDLPEGRLFAVMLRADPGLRPSDSLAVLRADDVRDPLTLRRRFSDLCERYDGSLLPVSDAIVLAAGAEEPFVQFVRFETNKAATLWATEPEQLTEFALLPRRVRDLALTLYAPARF